MSPLQPLRLESRPLLYHCLSTVGSGMGDSTEVRYPEPRDAWGPRTSRSTAVILCSVGEYFRGYYPGFFFSVLTNMNFSSDSAVE